jgi:hypothetical protein
MERVKVADVVAAVEKILPVPDQSPGLKAISVGC